MINIEGRRRQFKSRSWAPLISFALWEASCNHSITKIVILVAEAEIWWTDYRHATSSSATLRCCRINCDDAWLLLWRRQL